jgi:hypothetical protein
MGLDPVSATRYVPLDRFAVWLQDGLCVTSIKLSSHLNSVQSSPLVADNKYSCQFLQ